MSFMVWPDNEMYAAQVVRSHRSDLPGQFLCVYDGSNGTHYYTLADRSVWIPSNWGVAFQ